MDNINAIDVNLTSDYMKRIKETITYYSFNFF